MKKKYKKASTYTPLVSQLLGNSAQISHLPQIAWGREHEKDAVQSFLSDIASQHVNSFHVNGLYVKGAYHILLHPQMVHSIATVAPINH